MPGRRIQHRRLHGYDPPRSMITAVDTNVLLDVLGGDKHFGDSSAAALRRCLSEGALIACEAVWAETATAFPSAVSFANAMLQLTVSFDSITEEAALKAAEAWRRYRSEGGKRDRVASDFLIGGHASVSANRLLTRDRGFFRKHFAGLKVLDPSLDRTG